MTSPNRGSRTTAGATRSRTADGEAFGSPVPPDEGAAMLGSPEPAPPGAYGSGPVPMSPTQLSPVVQQEIAELIDYDSCVVYVGSATERRVSAESWSSAGVREQEAVVWDRANNWAVPVEDLSDRAIAVLRRDGDFRFPKKDEREQKGDDN